jgi:hypothetical protein
MEDARSLAIDRALLVASILLPGCLAASRVLDVADAAHDEAMVRTLGLGWSGAWRALDALASATFMVVPIGTRATRAALASATICGASGGALFVSIRALLGSLSKTALLGAGIAAIAAATASLSMAWQLEASSPGGSVLGAALAVLPVAIAAAQPRKMHYALFPVLVFLCALALSYEPLVGLAAMGSLGIFLGIGRSPLAPVAPLRSILGAVLGGAPLAFAFQRRAATHLTLDVAPLAQWLGERGESPRMSPVAFLHDQLGWLFLALAAGGLVLGLAAARGRALTCAFSAWAVIGIAGVALGAPAGPGRYGSCALLALAAVAALASVAMQALVRWVAEARVPFASASAAMILLLELTFPALAADESQERCESRTKGASFSWDQEMWGGLVPRSVVLVGEAPVIRRVMAARATGELRGDLVFLPLRDLGGRGALHALAREPMLGPFFRDMTLGGVPTEFSLSSLASSRPLALAFQPRWERALARHLVATGGIDRFEPEPRGNIERKKGLDAFLPGRERLAKSLSVPRDAELMVATASLLRARALACAASGDRELLSRALDDLAPFAPDDAVAAQLVRRAVIPHGSIEIKDLAP